MNWVGGARKRVHSQSERKSQDQYFERKKWERRLKNEDSSKPSGSADRRLAMSQDILAVVGSQKGWFVAARPQVGASVLHPRPGCKRSSSSIPQRMLSPSGFFCRDESLGERKAAGRKLTKMSTTCSTKDCLPFFDELGGRRAGLLRPLAQPSTTTPGPISAPMNEEGGTTLDTTAHLTNSPPGEGGGYERLSDQGDDDMVCYSDIIMSTPSRPASHSRDSNITNMHDFAIAVSPIHPSTHEKSSSSSIHPAVEVEVSDVNIDTIANVSVSPRDHGRHRKHDSYGSNILGETSASGLSDTYVVDDLRESPKAGRLVTVNRPRRELSANADIHGYRPTERSDNDYKALLRNDIAWLAGLRERAPLPNQLPTRENCSVMSQLASSHNVHSDQLSPVPSSENSTLPAGSTSDVACQTEVSNFSVDAATQTTFTEAEHAITDNNISTFETSSRGAKRNVENMEYCSAGHIYWPCGLTRSCSLPNLTR